MIENTFITWQMLTEYTSFVAVVFMFVSFTKEMPYLKSFKTQYYSAVVAYIGLIVVDLHKVATTDVQFDYWNLFIFALSAIAIAMFNGAVADKTSKIK